MPLHKKSMYETKFTLLGLGQFEWLTSPMGLIGCPPSFQQLMEKLMKNHKNVIVYIDDVLINSKAHEDHFSALDEVLQGLTNSNMKINLANAILEKLKSHTSNI